MDIHGMYHLLVPPVAMGVAESEDDHSVERYLVCLHQRHGKQVLLVEIVRSLLLLLANR